MATERIPIILLHLRGMCDDDRFVEAFKQAGASVRPVNHLGEALAVLNLVSPSLPRILVMASAQHGGIALLEMLAEIALPKRVKVILIDSTGDVRTAIKALRLGVADYFTQDLSQQALLKQVGVLMQMPDSPLDEGAQADPAPPVERKIERIQGLVPSALHGSDAISINANLRAIRKGDMWVSLSPIEWRLFEELIQHRGRIVTFEDLVKRGLHRDRVTASETSLLRLHMSRLRAKLGAHFERDLNIITLRGRGYMLA
jgi:DNA-binding response OmpR family regulator